MRARILKSGWDRSKKGRGEAVAYCAALCSWLRNNNCRVQVEFGGVVAEFPLGSVSPCVDSRTGESRILLGVEGGIE